MDDDSISEEMLVRTQVGRKKENLLATLGGPLQGERKSGDEAKFHQLREKNQRNGAPRPRN